MKIYVIIVSYNGGKNLINLVKQINIEKKQFKNYKICVLIVDNNSTDGSIMGIKADKIIKNRFNLGFAVGCNLGIEYALKNKADKILLLNQDLVIKKGFGNIFKNSTAEIISPLIKFKRDRYWIYDYGGRINWWIGRTKHLEKKKIDLKNFTSSEKIDYLSGCCLIIRSEVFKKIGLFDNKYFLYFEDVDFCLRAIKAGFSLKIDPKIIVIHKLKEQQKKDITNQLLLVKSNFIFINQYLGLKRPLGYLYLLFLLIKIIKNRYVV